MGNWDTKEHAYSLKTEIGTYYYHADMALHLADRLKADQPLYIDTTGCRFAPECLTNLRDYYCSTKDDTRWHERTAIKGDKSFFMPDDGLIDSRPFMLRQFTHDREVAVINRDTRYVSYTKDMLPKTMKGVLEFIYSKENTHIKIDNNRNNFGQYPLAEFCVLLMTLNASKSLYISNVGKIPSIIYRGYIPAFENPGTGAAELTKQIEADGKAIYMSNAQSFTVYRTDDGLFDLGRLGKKTAAELVNEFKYKIVPYCFGNESIPENASEPWPSIQVNCYNTLKRYFSVTHAEKLNTLYTVLGEEQDGNKF